MIKKNSINSLALILSVQSFITLRPDHFAHENDRPRLGASNHVHERAIYGDALGNGTHRSEEKSSHNIQYKGKIIACLTLRIFMR